MDFQKPPAHLLEEPKEYLEGVRPISKDIFDDLEIQKRLNKAKFPLFLVSSKTLNKLYVMKAFPLIDGQINTFFYREARFSNLSHPHIISFKKFQPKRQGFFHSKPIEFSCILMEYAPYGDFCDLIKSGTFPLEEKLARTYFHQLINGLEYLHSNGIAHLDLKLENILLGDDSLLKIADFDLSYAPGDPKVMTKGTLNYRAPELISSSDFKNLMSADIYSAGIILFALKTGIIPYVENCLVKGVDLYDLMLNSIDLFWKKHCELQGRPMSFFDNSFKTLFESLTSIDPEKRPTINAIKKSKWYNGPIYTPDELSTILTNYRV